MKNIALIFTLFTFVFFIAVSTAQNPGDKYVCCGPQELHGVIQGKAHGIQNGTMVFRETFYEHFFYDYEGKKFRVDFDADVDRTDYNGTVIYRYDEGTMWDIQPNGPCYWANIPSQFSTMPPMCVPEHFDHSEAFVLGGEMFCTQYSYHFEVANTHDHLELTVSHPHQRLCLPVAGNFFEHLDAFRMNVPTSFTYLNLKDGIDDPFLFEHPAQSDCKQISFPNLQEHVLEYRFN
eukprot:CAMPEP_0201551184 /NCGR_PEP_ID=MMETSP0173_2-20130828/7407_1 /ASSEMBLY_ACC=CAM_ASM_000268 /TAXON_ID=218659 /ORGANISM="Vexillifera sp., Strain DIVA3 564/2" /LENGTH=233 /DNA_ID=CAMNT_0047961381 /DNA_START=49 /DNA_END=750 /DNA_ORIENTATION=+